MDIHAPSRVAFNPAAFRELFRDPPAAYRGAPFWSWNGEVCREELLEQLDAFAVMGMGGARAPA
jgi:hypothetical protein